MTPASNTPSGLRIDIRAETVAAAANEFTFNNTCIILASAEIVDALLTDWSDPVQLMAERGADGLVNLIVRSVDGL